MVYADLDQPEFVKMVVEEAYKAKASKVIVEWDYQPLAKIHTRYQSLKTMSTVPEWVKTRRQHMVDTVPCRIHIISEDPDGLKGMNMAKLAKARKRMSLEAFKLAMEQGKVGGKTKFVTTRFGNVLGSNGSVIPRFRDQIAKGGPVTVTHPEITRFFMTIPEACRLVMEAATMSQGNQIFVFDMGESVKIDDLARRMIKLAGFTPDKDIMVEYSGLRPGEKLYEEVLSNKENTIPTDHDRIMIAKVRSYDYEHASEVADELERLSRSVETQNMVRLMKRTVPEFKSKNSRFEVYDREIEGAL